MANKSPAFIRLKKDYRSLKKDPEPYIKSEPDPQNILNWHYVIAGPPDTPYENGFYHGLLKFPKEYPFKPPSIVMYTPSGRFQTNTRLCLSMSDYHPESWNPSWSVGTILTGLVSFMVGSETSVGTTQSSDKIKQKLAAESFDWCISRSTPRGRKFNELFEDFVEEQLEARRKKQVEERLKAINCGEGGGSSTDMNNNSKTPTQNDSTIQTQASSDYVTSSVLFAFFLFFAVFIVPKVMQGVS